MTTPAPAAPSSLYAGDLHPEVNEATLYEIFNTVGPVASIRVCRDFVPRRSLGYAYINFHNAVDAERALDTLNFTNIRGQNVRLMWSHRDPSLRRSGQGNVFVKNLDKTTDIRSLYDTFSVFGNILSCKIASNEKGESKGYGFVHFETDEAAKKAIDGLNNTPLGTSPSIFVGPFIRRPDRQAPEAERVFTNVFVKNLPENTSDDKLESLFASHGPITSVMVTKDETGKPKGFGFINFQNAEDARHAVEQMHGAEVEGKQLHVCRAQKRSEREAELKHMFEAQKAENQLKYVGVNLYVKNLEDTVDDDKLREAFSKFGTITSTKVMRDEKGVSKGFGFVCFSSPDEATRAVTEMNRTLLYGKPLYVSLHQRKDVRRAQLEAQYSQRITGVPAYGPGGPFPMPPMYPQPMFYPGGMPGRMVYPPQPVMARGWAPNANAGVAGAGGRQPSPPAPNMMPTGFRPAFAPMGVAPRAPGRGRRQQQQQQPRVAPVPVAGRGGKPKTEAAPATEEQVLTAAYLANLSPESQKQAIGERLYPLIAAVREDLAPKITGMLLEMDNAELLMLLESQEALSAKVNEAMEVLREHGLVETA
eukprot:GILI01000643.1.p2 GENE.GILI01000643.1~~GILI01000643.1.p2  ORF type:complete len:590 (-),score=224.90 GILI01000643.1:271-2040(-)